MNRILPFPRLDAAPVADAEGQSIDLHVRHPISRWYVCPLAEVVAERLVQTRVRPCHVTLLGVVWLGLATWIIASGYPMWGALLVWLAWCCDRLDGALARAQHTATSWGGWFDANIDELGDIVLHAACAACAAAVYAAVWPWLLFAAFVGAKYLWQYGIRLESEITARQMAADSNAAQEQGRDTKDNSSRLRRLYHLPGNADLRMHFLIVMLAVARPELELAFVAAYFGMRTTVRAGLVHHRLTSTDENRAEQSSAAPFEVKEAA